jgi:3'-phosphoadenosine 5'-phosphosulfate sulfotransferase (PAPS reductase)/FAD synthetase
MMREPPVKKVLYWCRSCNVPLLGKSCGCGEEGDRIQLLKPYDVRPVLDADRELLLQQVSGQFGIGELPAVILLNKTGGLDRNDLVIANGARFGWLSFQPCEKRWSFTPEFDALPWLLPRAGKGIVDLETAYAGKEPISDRRIGGKRLIVGRDIQEGSVLLRYKGLTGIGTVREGYMRVRKLGRFTPDNFPDPGWETVVERNRQHLKNLERHAVRFIRQHMNDRPHANVSFSGGKDSTAVLELARRAGVAESYYIDTGMEFPETLSFIEDLKIPVRLYGGGLLHRVHRLGPPKKDNRWCCDELKLRPVKEWLAGKKCVTVQGNRWYESFSRSGLPPVCENPFYPGQLNISPIRNWRALEVFLYIWWRHLPLHPLYNLGMERIGCWMCPAMLESEFELVKKIHPDLHELWMEALKDYYKGKRMPDTFFSCGFWRWDNLPPKMKQILGGEIEPSKKTGSSKKSGRRISRVS